jgi:hypothetical protein
LSFTITSPAITCSGPPTFALNATDSGTSGPSLGDTAVSEHAASEATASAVNPADKKRDIYLPPGWVNYAELPAAVVSRRRVIAQCAAGEKD